MKASVRSGSPNSTKYGPPFNFSSVATRKKPPPRRRMPDGRFPLGRPGVFGVTGDLAHKMIFPALYAMAKRGTLKVPMIGVALAKWSRERLHKRVTGSVERSGGIDNQPALKTSSAPA